MKALHLGGRSQHNISAVFAPPSFPGGFHLMQGSHLYFLRENTHGRKDRQVIQYCERKGKGRNKMRKCNKKAPALLQGLPERGTHIKIQNASFQYERP